MLKKIGNQRMRKQIRGSTMEVTRKRGRPCKRWIDEVEVDLNIMGIKNTQGLIRDLRQRRKILLETTFHDGV